MFCTHSLTTVQKQPVFNPVPGELVVIQCFANIKTVPSETDII